MKVSSLMKPMQASPRKIKSLSISAIAISSVVFVEFTLGLAVGSLAIISDGAHALLDAFATLICLYATRASLKPPDAEHMYGHEKLEPLGSLIAGLILMGTALFLLAESCIRLSNASLHIVQELEFVGFIAIAYTFTIDILRIKVLHGAAEGSATVKADLYHAIADFGSTLIALAGFSLAVIGFPIFDALASLILSISMAFLSVRLIWTSGMELSDAVSKDLPEKIRREITSTQGVSKITQLKVRRAGSKTFIEASVEAPDYLSFEEAHNLASEIEAKLKRSLDNVDAVIHVEPAYRKMPTPKLIEKLAYQVKGITEIHDVNVVHVNSKPQITLHARVAPNTSLEDAHRLAEEIEAKIAEEIENVGNVTVHMEPSNEYQKRGPEADEEEIRRAVLNAVEKLGKHVEVKRVTTYVAQAKRYVNIDCRVESQISIEKAHELASRIEDYMREHFAEVVVNVHLEPEKGK